ncbi:serine hydrolase [Frondihabitans australicus]|uniref:Beta-lactamase class A n=1 Tax=Frondihabitans australicus TaxID=386892 RepID=A0A495IG95_9MICO|nr:serine hydrolase [Frondihabitans australicus]RKR75043.1 beta-lactamase class A [Frondihabitans australicus]
MIDDARFLDRVRSSLDEAGLRGSLVVRDLDTGRTLSLDADAVYPAASLAKIPVALAVAEAIEGGTIDPGLVVEVSPGGESDPAPTGITRFRHPARIAVEDLLSLAVTISDNSAADRLLDLVPLEGVRASLRAAGIDGFALRHRFQELADTPLDGTDPAGNLLAHTLAVEGGAPDGGHAVAQLDLARANTVTATAAADLLQELWRPRHVSRRAAARVRALMAANAIRHRLAPEFDSDSTRWSSKTGTLLTYRHEAGVVDHEDGSSVAVVALSASRVPARIQPGADIALAAAARELYERVRVG